MNKSSLFVSMAVVISLVFTMSCVSKEVPITETYYETKYRTEPYVETTESGQEYITPKWKRYIPGLYFTALEWAKSGAESHLDGYEIDTAKVSKGQIKLVLSNSPQASIWGILVVNRTGLGPISGPPSYSKPPLYWYLKIVEGGATKVVLWIDEFNAIIADPKHLLYWAESDQYTDTEMTFDITGVEEFAVITCTPTLMDPVIEKVQLIWSKEVTKERQVPYEVEKQRTVMQTKKVPFWEVFFR